jgi:hypothetical protein
LPKILDASDGKCQLAQENPPRPANCSIGSALTFKIERIAGANRLTIRLIGRLDADCLAELEAQIASGAGRIEFDMEEVTLVDIDVVRFLVACEARGIQLRGCSAYISDWIRRERDSGSGESGDSSRNQK